VQSTRMTLAEQLIALMQHGNRGRRCRPRGEGEGWRMLTQRAAQHIVPVAGLILLAFAHGRTESQVTVPSTPPFEQAVRTHLAAIGARDMDALLPTLTTRDTLVMIAPDGTKWETREQFVDFHRQWFATKDDGRYEAEIVRTIESPALGHALIRYRYSSKGPGGQARVTTAWLALTFALESGTWRLVFDQNTLLTARDAK
jgi:ketosteroid isomerase-like protein